MATRFNEVMSATRVFGGPWYSTNQQVFEVTPTPAARLNATSWNRLLRGAAVDYAQSLGFGFGQVTPAELRYSSLPIVNKRAQVKESWAFDWMGKIHFSRKVQATSQKAIGFDLDDFAQALTKFCLHSLNLFLQVNPSPDGLDFLVSLAHLGGGTLQSDLMAGRGPSGGTGCRAARVFSVPLRPASDTVHILRGQILLLLRGVAAAYEPTLYGPALKLAVEHFAALYSEALSTLTLQAVPARIGLFGSTTVT